MRSRPLILIVEDEALLSNMYAKKLELDGFDYLVANNGDDGLRLAMQHKPDLILCDIMMPFKDGLTVLEELKASADTKDIPVIVLSNLSREEYIDKALQTGAVTYLVKSKTVPADVVTKIKEVLTQNGVSKLATDKQSNT